MKKNKSFDSTMKPPYLHSYQRSSFISPYTINGVNILKNPKRTSCISLSKSNSKTTFSSNIPLPTKTNQTEKYMPCQTIPNNKKIFLKLSTRLLGQNSTLSSSSKSLIKKSIETNYELKPLPEGVVEIFQPKETAGQFLMKTNELIKWRYIAGIKAERVERLKETYNNEVESINDRIKAIGEAKVLFSETFCNKFHTYIKHLIMQKNAEKIQLKKIKTQKMQAENEILHLNNAIRRKEAELLKNQKWYILQKKIKMKISPQVKRSSIFKGIELFFKSPEELIAELKRIEMSNVSLLNKYNDYTIKIMELQIQKESQLLEINNSLMHLLKVSEQKTIELEKLKSLNKELKLEKEQILKDKISSSINKCCGQKLYQTILTIENKINKFAPYNKNNLNLHSPVDRINMISLLSYIERTLDYYLQKKLNYSLNTNENNQKAYQCAIKKAWKDRKALLNQKIKEENENKMSQLAQKVSYKNNKILFLPYRLKDKYCYQIATRENSKTKKKINKTFDKKIMSDFLYDIDDSV